MELTRPKRWIYAVVISIAAVLVLLGSWWMLLVNRLSSGVMEKNIETQAKVANMIKWEGTTFFALILAFCALLIYLYLQDRKKYSSIQKFLASMTHELKTPLTSIKMQSEFIGELLEDENIDSKQIQKLLARLTEDGIKLENHLDRLLQLSRVELGGKLNLESLDLNIFLKSIKASEERITIDESLPFKVMADEWALRIIFRNLIENSKKHCRDFQKVNLSFKESPSHNILIYKDNGIEFSGELNQLSTLFYKHDSKKGSGIGLYLIKKLMQQMSGDLLIENNKGLTFKLLFQKVAS